MVRVAVYFDTSGSMSRKVDGEARIDLARQIWKDVLHRFNGYFSKISTINSRGKSKVLGKMRKRNTEALERIEIPNPGGGTYLWGFLVEEAEKLVKKDNEWIFLLISDGGDGESLGELHGSKGLEPCARKIKELGLDVEFHIIGLGLSEEVAKSFNKLSGESGGYFQNISSTSEVQSTVDKLDSTLSEIGDEGARARRRQSRHLEYVESSASPADPVLDLTPPRRERVLNYGGNVEVLSTLSPPETIDWLEDLLKIRGHVNTLRADSGEFWFEVESELPVHETQEGVERREDCWAIDSERLIQSLTPIQEEPQKKRILSKLKRLIFRSSEPEVEGPKPKSVHDIFFELAQDIRQAAKEDRKKIIFRGDEFPEVYYNMLRDQSNQGRVELMIYPKMLPPPPPPSYDSDIVDVNDWLSQINPAREDWIQFPREFYDDSSILESLKKGVIIDSFIHSSHWKDIQEQIDPWIAYRKLRIAIKRSSMGKRESLDITFLDPRSSKAEYIEWCKKEVLTDTEIELVSDHVEYLRVIWCTLLRQYFKLEGMNPFIVVFRLCNLAKDMRLHHHPFYLQIKQLTDELKTRAILQNTENKDGNINHRWKELQIDEF